MRGGLRAAEGGKPVQKVVQGVDRFQVICQVLCWHPGSVEDEPADLRSFVPYGNYALRAGRMVLWGNRKLGVVRLAR